MNRSDRIAYATGCLSLIVQLTFAVVFAVIGPWTSLAVFVALAVATTAALLRLRVKVAAADAAYAHNTARVLDGVRIAKTSGVRDATGVDSGTGTTSHTQ